MNETKCAKTQLQSEIAILASTAFSILSASIAWLAYIGWSQSVQGELLFIVVALTVSSVCALAYAVIKIGPVTDLGVLSKARILSLAGFFLVYVVLLGLGICGFASPAAYSFAVAPFVLGMAIRVWAVFVMASPAKPRASLIMQGPFALVRHPRYLGTLIAIFATCVTVRPFSFLLWIATVPVVLHIVAALKEEQQFLADPGLSVAYERYQREVPLLVPTWHSLSALKVDLARHYSKSQVSSILTAAVLVYVAVLFRTWFEAGR